MHFVWETNEMKTILFYCNKGEPEMVRTKQRFCSKMVRCDGPGVKFSTNTVWHTNCYI